MDLLKIFRSKSPEKVHPGHAALCQADPFSFQASHRRLAWMLRLSAGTNIGLLIGIGLCLSTLSAMLPLKEIRPAFIRVDPAENRIYRVLPLAQETEGFNLLLEQMSRRYVRNMLEIDSVTQGTRFKEAFVMTDNDFYERFRERHIESGSIQDAIDSGLVRSISVENVFLSRRLENVWEYAVNFTQIDKRDGKLVERKKLRAFLKITTRPHEVTEAEKFENPLGIRVLDMVVKESGNI